MLALQLRHYHVPVCDEVGAPQLRRCGAETAVQEDV